MNNNRNIVQSSYLTAPQQQQFQQQQQYQSQINQPDMSNMHHTIATRMSDDESDEEEDQINIDQITYNSLIIEAYNAFQRRDLKVSIDFYLKALGEAEKYQNVERISLIKSNLAVIYFHSCQYKQAEQQLKEAADLLKQGSQHSDHRSALQVKVYANLAIVNIILNKFDEAIQANDEAMNTIYSSKDIQKRDLLEELVYLYFRFLSFESMGNGIFDNAELKYDEPTLACFYSSMALNRELCNDNQAALNYHEKALKMWEQINDPGFSLLTLKHIIQISQQYPDQQNIAQYQNRMNELLKHPDFKGVNPDTLFKKFEEKIKCAKSITQALKRTEQQSVKQFQSQVNKSILKSNMGDILNEYGEPLWKQALRLRLYTSISYSKSLLKDDKIDKKQREAISLGMEQMQKTIFMLKNEKHPLVEKQLSQMPFTKTAIDNLKAAVNRLKKMILTVTYLEAFDKLQDFMIDKSRMSQTLKQQKRVDTLINNAYKYVMVGDYLLKCNKTTNGRLQKFFQLAPDSTLRWTSRERNINKKDKIQYYCMQDVKGVLYGKHTDVLQKPFNKKLEPWLCFSLVLKSRTLDFYCEKDQINRWLFALSEETKRKNPTAFVLKPSQVLWRKMKMILYHHFVDPHLTSKERKVKHSFVKAIIAFNRSGQKLPTEKDKKKK
ncbi:hypothetical protein ABPG72_020738 [Tetrahymena utriculariae]